MADVAGGRFWPDAPGVKPLPDNAADRRNGVERYLEETRRLYGFGGVIRALSQQLTGPGRRPGNQAGVAGARIGWQDFRELFGLCSSTHGGTSEQWHMI